MRCLSIDQSLTHCAYVICDGTNLESFDVWTTDKNDNVHVRCFKLAMKMIEVIMLNKIEKVVFEGLAFGSQGNATRDLSGLLFVLIHSVLEYNTMYEVNVDIKIIPPTTLKKFATGKGTASKEEIVNATPNEIIAKFKEQNFKKTTGLVDLCDAYWLSQFKDSKNKL